MGNCCDIVNILICLLHTITTTSKKEIFPQDFPLILKKGIRLARKISSILTIIVIVRLTNG